MHGNTAGQGPATGDSTRLGKGPSADIPAMA